MEEKKEVKKEVKPTMKVMGGKGNAETEPRKLSYEQLAELATQLDRRCREQQKQIVELSDFVYFKQMEFMFEVIKNYSSFPPEFVERVAEDIQNRMYPKQEETDDTPVQ